MRSISKGDCIKKTFLIFNFMVGTALVQPVMAQSTLEQWQRLMPNSGSRFQVPAVSRVLPYSQALPIWQAPANLQAIPISQALPISRVSRGYFVDPYDIEMRGARIAAQRGQWSRAWRSFGYGLHSLLDPELNAARLEIENAKKSR